MSAPHTALKRLTHAPCKNDLMEDPTMYDLNPLPEVTLNFPDPATLTDAELIDSLDTFLDLISQMNALEIPNDNDDRAYLRELQNEYTRRITPSTFTKAFYKMLLCSIVAIVLIAVATHTYANTPLATTTQEVPTTTTQPELISNSTVPAPSPDPVNDNLFFDLAIYDENGDPLAITYGETDNDTITQLQWMGYDIKAYCPDGYFLIESDNSCQLITSPSPV